MSRVDYGKVSPEAVHAQLQIEKFVRNSSLDKKIIELIKMRCSMINGCAFCLDMHSKDALAEGETTQRLFGLGAWRETTYYTPRERAALAWAEAVTQISTNHVEDDLYNEVKAQFSDKEMVELTMAVIAINGWNRLAISFRTEAGTYQPGQHK